MRCIMTFTVVVVLCGVGTVACEWQNSTAAGAEPMSKNKKLLKLVDLLISRKPRELDKVSWELAKVSKATGFQFEIDATSSNEYFTVYHSKGKPTDILKHVEVRLPTRSSSAKGGMVILDVTPDVTLTGKEIYARFGDIAGISIPSPPVMNPRFPCPKPAELPTYYVYRFRWGKASFGFARDNGRLVAVVLNAI